LAVQAERTKARADFDARYAALLKSKFKMVLVAEGSFAESIELNQFASASFTNLSSEAGIPSNAVVNGRTRESLESKYPCPRGLGEIGDCR
jgi:hypothetical protein